MAPIMLKRTRTGGTMTTRLILFSLSLAAALSACGGDDDGGDNTDGSEADANGGGGAAEAFCSTYGFVCMFDDNAGDASRFDDQPSCIAAFNGFSAARQTCVAEHVGLAEDAEDGSGEEDMHCGHATGEAPCN